MKQKIENFENYVKDFPVEIQKILNELKDFIAEMLPENNLTIKYAIPTFVVKGKNLVHFGAFKNHIGLYPGTEAIDYFIDELQDYKISKGAIQFPLNQQLPFPLIHDIINYLLNKN